MGLVGCQFCLYEHINGVVISVRPFEDILSIWLDTTEVQVALDIK